MNEKHTFKEIGFLVHTAELFVHFGPVWEKLGLDAFQIVVAGSPFENQRILELAKNNSISHVLVNDVITSGYRYPVMVSNHSITEYAGKPLVSIIGIHQIRFMYALGKGRHNFADWNRCYDIILCFGPYQVEKLKFCADTIKIQMGYPRYDKYFSMQIDEDAFLKQLGCDPGKETILWLPTWKDLSSIDLYADQLSKLSGEYNIIAKTHPLSLEAEPHKIERLTEMPFTAVISNVFDNAYLYKVSDYVLCDYGGPLFGALYLDKNLLLLNIPNPGSDELAGDESPDILVRKDIVNIDPDDACNLGGILKNKALWEEQKAVRQNMRKTFFAPHYGFSSEVAALAIKNAGTIINAC